MRITEFGDVAQRHVLIRLDGIQFSEDFRFHQTTDVVDALRQGRRCHQSVHRLLHRRFHPIPNYNQQQQPTTINSIIKMTKISKIIKSTKTIRIAKNLQKYKNDQNDQILQNYQKYKNDQNCKNLENFK